MAHLKGHDEEGNRQQALAAYYSTRARLDLALKLVKEVANEGGSPSLEEDGIISGLESAIHILEQLTGDDIEDIFGSG